MKKAIYKIAIYCLLPLCFCFGIIATISIAAQKMDENIKAELVWSQFNGRNYQILYSRFENNRWSDDIQITNTSSSDILPCIGKGPDGTTYIVWSVLNGAKSKLYYSRFDGSAWSEPTSIETAFTANMAPSIFIASDNVPWLVWSGFDGKVDNIYFTKWNGKSWDSPQKVNADNAAPDILPVIGMNQAGNPWVYWSGYDGGGNYRNYASVWNGSGWGDETEEDVADNPYQAIIKAALEALPDLPPSLTDHTKASIYIEGGGLIQSLPLRYMDKK